MVDMDASALTGLSRWAASYSYFNFRSSICFCMNECTMARFI